MIEVGEYIRDKEGNITKIQNLLNLDREVYLYLGEDGYQYSDNAIKSYSKNIIDLIEVGDVIRLKGEEKLKYEVLKISWSESKGKHIHIINPFRTEGGKDIFIEDIETILTKEQFKKEEYKIN